jgi:hypothetical protein
MISNLIARNDEIRILRGRLNGFPDLAFLNSRPFAAEPLEVRIFGIQVRRRQLRMPGKENEICQLVLIT